MDFNFGVLPMTMKHFGPEIRKKNIKLHNDCVNKECINKGRPSIFLDVGHKKTESNKHHDIDILVHGVVCLIGIEVGVGFNSDKDPV